MSDLVKIIQHKGQLVVSSRQISSDFEKRHNDVVRTIDEKIKNLTTENFVVEKFFLLTTFNHNGNEYKEYLLTRDGFSFLVMGFTGAKADIWKIKYIEAFNKMEQYIKQQIDTTQLSPELQMFKTLFDTIAKQELEQKHLCAAVEETKQELQEVREVIEINPSKNWRSETNNLIKKICFKINDYKLPKDNIYRALEERAGCDLKRRLENMRARLLLNGGTKSKADSLNYLDVIAEDKKLIEIYTAIVKEMSIKYAV